jgi:hypothetical protein
MFSRIDELEERVKRLESVLGALLQAAPPLEPARLQALLAELNAPITPGPE